MAEWEPITLGTPTVRASDLRDRNMVDVRIPLSRTPDAAWTRIFNAGPPPNVEFGVLSHPKTASRAVTFSCPAGAVEKYYDQAKRWVEGTNAAYEEQVLPEEKRRQEAADAEEVERGAAVDEARRRLGLNN